MKSETSPRSQAAIPPSKSERSAAALAAGRAKRHANRELLLQREHANDPPPNALRAVVKLLLCSVIFLPLIGIGAGFVWRIDEQFGSTPAWIAAFVGAFLLATAVYNGPRVLARSANDVIGIFKYRKRNPAAFWGAVVFLLAWLLTLCAALQGNPAIHR